MRLWTWQNRKFDITDPNTRVETKSYSKDLDASYNPDYCNRHLKAYEILWGILKDDQFHWCYTNWEDAINSSSLASYKGKILWELDMPEDMIFKKICGMDWHWIVSDGITLPSNIFENLFRKLLPFLFWNYNKIPFEPFFNQPWRDMKRRQLWDCLFAECGVHQCYDVLVHHPVNASWVVKNPRKNINWWQNAVNQTAHCNPGFPRSRE